MSEVGSPPHIPLLSCGCSSAALLPLGAVLENCSKNINSHEGQSAGDHIKQFFDSPKPAGDQQIEKLYQESENSILPFKFFSRQEKKHKKMKHDGNDWTINVGISLMVSLPPFFDTKEVK